MVDCIDGCVKGALGQFIEYLETILVSCLVLIGERIIGSHVDRKLLKMFDELGYFCVPYIRAVFFERESQHEKLGTVNFHSSLQHPFQDILGNKHRHIVIGSPARQNHVGMEADGLCLMGQVIRINADTVASDKPWRVAVKIPLGASS